MSDGKSREATLRGLPSVDQLMRHPDIQGLRGGLSSEVLTRIIRDALAEVRSAVLAGAYRDIPAGELRGSLTGWVVTGVLARSEGFSDIGPHAVINATGVVLHTNLGRAPLSDAARQAVATSGAGYSDLEYRLDSGARGSRHDHLAKLFRDVLGTPASTPETLDAIAVNNCAGALLLTLAELARGREVIVSRGHLVEIGGGFRVPDVMRQSGATLVEVGTTNRTRLSDYANAITPATAAILKVHPGNFRIVGFTEDVATADLASLARKHGVPMIEDIGSGCLLEITDFGVPPSRHHRRRTGPDSQDPASPARPGAETRQVGGRCPRRNPRPLSPGRCPTHCARMANDRRDIRGPGHTCHRDCVEAWDGRLRSPCNRRSVGDRGRVASRRHPAHQPCGCHTAGNLRRGTCNPTETPPPQPHGS